MYFIFTFEGKKSTIFAYWFQRHIQKIVKHLSFDWVLNKPLELHYYGVQHFA